MKILNWIFIKMIIIYTRNKFPINMYLLLLFIILIQISKCEGGRPDSDINQKFELKHNRSKSETYWGKLKDSVSDTKAKLNEILSNSPNGESLYEMYDKITEKLPNIDKNFINDMKDEYNEIRLRIISSFTDIITYIICILKIIYATSIICSALFVIGLIMNSLATIVENYYRIKTAISKDKSI